MSTLRFLTLATTCLAAWIGAIAASPVAASSIMLTPVSFDFGNVFAGEQSAAQKITLTNTSNTPQTPQLAGGGVVWPAAEQSGRRAERTTRSRPGPPGFALGFLRQASMLVPCRAR